MLASYKLLVVAGIGRVMAQSGSGHGSSAGGASGAGGASSNSSSSSGHGGSGGPTTADIDNVRFATYTMVSVACVVLALAVYRLVLASMRYVRTLTCLDNEHQRFFKEPNWYYSFLKTHVIYSPLLRTRHHNEMRLFKGWGIGVLPTRFQSLFIAGIISMNVVLCVTGIEWEQAGTSQSANMLNHLRNRSGTLAVVNMIPLVIMAGRNNPLIPILGLSFDTFNLMHRWFGRVVVSEAIVHTLSWLIKSVGQKGWAGTAVSFQTSQTIISGLVVGHYCLQFL